MLWCESVNILTLRVPLLQIFHTLRFTGYWDVWCPHSDVIFVWFQMSYMSMHSEKLKIIPYFSKFPRSRCTLPVYSRIDAPTCISTIYIFGLRSYLQPLSSAAAGESRMEIENKLYTLISRRLNDSDFSKSYMGTRDRLSKLSFRIMNICTL